MQRYFALFLLFGTLRLAAQDVSPVIEIDSPDTATTFVANDIKSRALLWDEHAHQLSAEITFVARDPNALQDSDDTHRFRLPGITYDPVTGIFSARTAKGESIPIARRQKTLFVSSIKATPNAIVRIFDSRGQVTVRLEAIRPADIARAKSDFDPEATHAVDIRQLIQ